MSINSQNKSLSNVWQRNLVEIIELKNHPYFIASQFHPEFKSRPNRSEPLFQGFITAAFNRKYKK